MVIMNKKAKYIKGIENAVIQLLSALVVVLLFMWAKQGLTIVIQTKDWLPILWVGLLNTGISCFCYFSAIEKMPAQTGGLCGYLEHVAACILAGVILHEKMSELQIIGAILIIGNTIIAEQYNKISKKIWESYK